MADAAPAAVAGAAATTAAQAAPLPFDDLEAYIAPYSAPAKLDRLLWIAEQSAGTPLELEALRLAGDDVKKVRRESRVKQGHRAATPRLGGSRAAPSRAPLLPPSTSPQKTQTLLDTFNVSRYHEVMARIDGRLGPDYVLDELSAGRVLRLSNRASLAGVRCDGRPSSLSLSLALSLSPANMEAARHLISRPPLLFHPHTHTPTLTQKTGSSPPPPTAPPPTASSASRPSSRAPRPTW